MADTAFFEVATSPQEVGDEVPGQVADTLSSCLQGRRIPGVSKSVHDGVLWCVAAIDPGLLPRIQDRLVAACLASWPPSQVQDLASTLVPSYQEQPASVSALEYAGATASLPEQLALRYMDVVDGRVRVGRFQLQCVVAHAVKTQYPVTRLRPMKWVHATFRDAIEAAKKQQQATRDRLLDLRRMGHRESAYPPCIKKWLHDVQASKPLDHTARFNLVAFLNNVGLSEEDLVAVFSVRSDFDAAATRYQVRHIIEPVAGRGVGSGYLPMACRQLRGLDLCPDHQCPGPTPLRRYQALVGMAP